MVLDFLLTAVRDNKAATPAISDPMKPKGPQDMAHSLKRAITCHVGSNKEG